MGNAGGVILAQWSDLCSGIDTGLILLPDNPVSAGISLTQCNLVTLEQIIDNVGIRIMINITAQRRMQTTNASSPVQPGPRLCPQGNYAQHFSPKSREGRLFLICVHTIEGSQASHQAVVNFPEEVKCLQINMSPWHDSSSALTAALTPWDTGKLAWNWDRCNKVKCFNYVKFGPMNPARGMFGREQDLSHLLKCPTAAHLYTFEAFSLHKSLLGLIFIRRGYGQGLGWCLPRQCWGQPIITLHRSHQVSSQHYHSYHTHHTHHLGWEMS